jgi:hypothetical protein
VSGRYQMGDVHARSWVVGARNGCAGPGRQQSASSGVAAACVVQSVANGSMPACLQSQVRHADGPWHVQPFHAGGEFWRGIIRAADKFPVILRQRRDQHAH